MRRRLNMTLRRATSVGCAVKTGVMQICESRVRMSSAEAPAFLRARRVPRRLPR